MGSGVCASQSFRRPLSCGADVETKMTKKIIYITLAALLGAGIGAFLSYGPLKRFKSEAVLNIDIDIAGYKSFGSPTY